MFTTITPVATMASGRQPQLEAHVSRVCSNQAKSAHIQRPVVHIETSTFITDQHYFTTSHDGISVLLPGSTSTPIFATFDWLLKMLPTRKVNVCGIEHNVKTDVHAGTIIDQSVDLVDPNAHQGATIIPLVKEEYADVVCQSKVPPTVPPQCAPDGKKKNKRKMADKEPSIMENDDQTKGGKKRRVRKSATKSSPSATTVDATTNTAVGFSDNTEFMDMPCCESLIDQLNRDLHSNNGIDIMQDAIAQSGIQNIM